MSRYFGLVGFIFWAGFAIGQDPEPVLANKADAPIQVLSMKSVPSSHASDHQTPPGMPRMKSYEVAFQNNSGKKVMVVVVNYLSLAADGTSAKKTGVCGSRESFSTDEPAMKAQEVRTEIPNLNVNGVSVSPVIDLVVLEDGTAWGPNNCEELERYQLRLLTRRSVESWILKQLEERGADGTKALLQAELAQRGTSDKLFLAPKRIARQ
jgi:hypothetical protein